MFSSEIKETIYVAISCILAAAVLGLVAFVLDIRSDFANSRNMEMATKQSMETYTTFNKYQDEILYGEDVIAIIREFAGTDIAIYIEGLTDETGVERKYNSTSGVYVDNESYKIDGTLRHITSIKGLEYGDGAGNPLSGGVKRNTTYFSYLVFGEYGKDSIQSAKYKDLDDKLYYSDVTAIVIKKVGNGRHRLVESPINPNSIKTDECGCVWDTDHSKLGVCSATTIYANVRDIKNGIR